MPAREFPQIEACFVPTGERSVVPLHAAARSADAVLKSMGDERPAFAGLSLGKLGPLGKPAATAAVGGDA